MSLKNIPTIWSFSFSPLVYTCTIHFIPRTLYTIELLVHTFINESPTILLASGPFEFNYFYTDICPEPHNQGRVKFLMKKAARRKFCIVGEILAPPPLQTKSPGKEEGKIGPAITLSRLVALG